MERKIHLLEEGDDTVHGHHCETIGENVLLIVSVKFSFTGEKGLASINKMEVRLTHFGKQIWEGGMRCPLIFTPPDKEERYTNVRLSFNDQRVSIGMGGTSISRRNCGWLPKFLLVKIEPL